MRFNELPPIEYLPAAAADIAGDLLALRPRITDLNVRWGKLEEGNPDAAASRADTALLGKAARDGGDVHAVGTPNADALKAERSRFKLEADALKAAEDQLCNQLADTLHQHHDEALRIVDDHIKGCAADYVAALDAAATARRAWIEARSLDGWLTAVESNNQYVNYSAHAGSVDLGQIDTVDAERLLSSLRNEAAPAAPTVLTVGQT
jgi:hypothetical protein